MSESSNRNSKTYVRIGITALGVTMKVHAPHKRSKNMAMIENVNGYCTRDSGWQNFHPCRNGSKSFTTFLLWKSAIEGNSGRPRSADYYWQLKSDDTCKRKSNDEVFSMHGFQFDRIKSHRITVAKSSAICTSILSRCVNRLKVLNRGKFTRKSDARPV